MTHKRKHGEMLQQNQTNVHNSNSDMLNDCQDDEESHITIVCTSKIDSSSIANCFIKHQLQQYVRLHSTFDTSAAQLTCYIPKIDVHIDENAIDFIEKSVQNVSSKFNLVKVGQNLYTLDLSTSLPKQSMQNFPADMFLKSFDFLGTHETVAVQTVNKEWQKQSINTLKQQGFTYDGFLVPDDFENFMDSTSYQYCTHLLLPEVFNAHIDLPPKLQSFTMGRLFNQPIDFPESLLKLVMATDFDQHVVFPARSNLRELHLGQWYDKPIVSPQSLICLEMGDTFNQVIQLPEKLLELTMSFAYNRPIQFPQSLVKLKMGLYFDMPIQLPNNLQFFEMSGWFDQHIELPSTLKLFSMGHQFNRKISLPPNLEAFVLGNSFNKSIDLPNSLSSFEMGNSFDVPILLPSNLTHFRMGDSFNQTIELPSNLKYFKMGRSFNCPILLPNNLQYLVLNEIYSHDLVFPPSLKICKKLVWNEDFGEFEYQIVQVR